MLNSFLCWLQKVKVSSLLWSDGKTPDAETLRQARASQVEQLYEMDRGSGFKPVVAFFAATLFLGGPNWALSWAAFALYAASWVFLHSMQIRFLADENRGQSPELWATRFTMASCLTGAGWGFGSVAWITPGDLTSYAVVALIVVGLSASSAIARSIHIPSVLSFGAPAGVPIILLLGIHGSTFGLTLVVLGLMFFAALVEWTRSLNSLQIDTIALRHQNAALVSSLEKERKVALDAQRIAERANRTKTEFLTTMSHEVRTPLNGVLGMAHILQSSALDAEQKEQVDVIVESGEMLQTVLNDILDLSKLESGRFEVAAESFELVPVARSVVRLFATNAKAKDIGLEVQTDPSLTINAQADDHRTRQVLLNLVGNAVKFTENGEVDVVIAPAGSPLLPAALPEDLPAGHIVVAVNDTGIGIAPDRLDALFNPFTQADQSTTRRYGGTGLGLAICKRLVELMGGRIGGVSTPGQGSTFWFTLPGAEHEPVQAPVSAPGAPQAAATPKLILLAEDNDVNAMVAEALLKQEGHKIIRVRDGAEAVEEIVKRGGNDTKIPDVVLMDIRMPNLSGPDAARQIRALPAPLRHIPILALTADISTTEMREDGSASLPAEYVGLFDGALTKPIMPQQLSAAIADISGADVHVSGMQTEKLQVNMEHLKGLLDLLGSSQFSELIQTYVDDISTMAGDLETALAAHDNDRTAALCHNLVGASANLGFVALEDAARKMMKAAKADDKSALDTSHMSFRRAVDETNKVVKTLKTG